MSPDAILAAARMLLDDPDVLGRASRRATAFLVRGALEASLGEWLDQHARGARSANFRVQLLVLQRLGDEEASHIAWTWAALSQATHHHGYELPPTRGDLRRWLETVEGFRQRVAGQQR